MTAPAHTVLCGDCIEQMQTIPDASVNCCVTSPPYWGLRNYNVDGQIGLEQTPEEYVARMVAVFREVRRVLRDDGIVWLNLGDSYSGGGGYCPDAPSNQNGGSLSSRQDAGSGAKPKGRKVSAGLKPKDLVGIPWRVAFALQSDGWYLRQDIIWHKPNPMPESVTDRCTKAHEYIFLLTKSARYWYDAEAVKEECGNNTHGGSLGNRGSKQEAIGQNKGGNLGDWDTSRGRNRRSVWTVATQPFSGAHFAVFPPDLVEPCVLAGCPETVCAECGTGWERVVVRTKTFESGSGRSGNDITGKQDLSARSTNSTPDIRMGPCVRSQTIGWQPSCKCTSTETRTGTVLDPFGGSGTTALVAHKLGRRSILCELNPEYAEMARSRIADATAQLRLPL